MSIRSYEAVVAIHPETSAADQKGFFSQIQEMIQKCSGSVHHLDLLGSLPLANTGRKKGVKRGLYFHFSYQALGEVNREIQRLFRISEFVLYFHHEQLDSKISLDQHQKNLEALLLSSKQREEERQAHIQMKRKKFSSAGRGGEAVSS